MFSRYITLLGSQMRLLEPSFFMFLNQQLSLFKQSPQETSYAYHNTVT